MTDKDKIQAIKDEIVHYKGSVEGIEECFDIGKGKIEAINHILELIDSLPEEPTVKGITWKDINTLEEIINQTHYEFPNGIGEKNFGLLVLEKFNDYQDIPEEPVSEMVNLCDILKNSPKETELYSPIYGNLWLSDVDDNNGIIICYKKYLSRRK